MKTIGLVMIAALLLPTSVSAQVFVNGYVKKDGTYVAPHYRSSPNSTTLDNYSTKGNYNPYTGKTGTRDTTFSPYKPSYSTPKAPSFGTLSNDDADDYDPE